MLNGSDTAGNERRRSGVILIAVVVAFAVLTIQLYRLQIQQYDDYLRRSEQNAMRTVPISAVRGRILDRDGNIIVGNRPAYTLGVIPAEVTDPPRLDSLLSAEIDLPPGQLVEKVRENRRRHSPIELRRDAPYTTIAYLEEHRHRLPAVLYMVESRRRYPYGQIGAHFLGYAREIGQTQLASISDKSYSLGDLMGQTGIEAEYEPYLRGTKGEEYQEVTVRGQVIHTARREPVRGSDVRLSIDLDLQLTAEAAMDTIKRGALVAMDPNTGEILAMVSRPTFDPAVFSFVVPTSVWRMLNDNIERPMFNRAAMGTYPPGSTAKMITAIAGLDSGVITPTKMLNPCRGAMRYGNRTFLCWRESGHGAVNVVGAIERSCNVFFYQLGDMIGVDKWGQIARKFGFGERTGIDLPAEDGGIVASSDVYNRRMGRFGWTRGEALNVAIGQGITLVTPLQMARYTSALATGKLPKPHMALGLIDADGTEHALAVPPPEPLEIDPDLLPIIREGMILVTEGDHGTARRSRVPGYHVAGKTGTAQNPHGEDHSWYVGYVPADDPKIAVAVIAENAGHGSDIAAPIAGRIMRRYMLRDRSRTQPVAETTQIAERR
ncbi:MAG: penicillin-binding protein 2 [Sphaerochaeta sp.]|jgi:penicillin-binding protein 2|nr:penicillin-binding protein 2 [Sphaerochaeta sp.]